MNFLLYELSHCLPVNIRKQSQKSRSFDRGREFSLVLGAKPRFTTRFDFASIRQKSAQSRVFMVEINSLIPTCVASSHNFISDKIYSR